MFSYMNQGKKFYREVAMLAIPMVLQNMVTTSLGLLDSFMVGLLGEAPLAAVTMANTPVMVIMLMTFGLQSGGSVLMSQFYGKGDYDSINRVLGIGFYAAAAVTLIFGSVMFFFPVQFMGLFGNDASVVALAAKYGKIVAFSFFFDSMTSVYVAAHRSMANPKPGMVIFMVSMVLNTFLNWVFIFGRLGAPAMGVEGAALATLIARMTQLLMVVLHILFLNKRFQFKPALALKPGGGMIHRYIRYSLPVVFNETLWGLGSSLYPTIMGHMAGSQAILAAYGVAGNIERLCTVAIFGVSGAASIIIGREIGAGKDREKILNVGKALDTLAVLVGAVVGVIFIGVTHVFFAPVVYPLFGLSPEATEIATMMLVVTFSFLFFRAFNSTNVVGVIRGGGDVKTAAFIDLAPMWLVAIPTAALAGLVFQWGILAVYLCMALDNVVKALLGVHRLRSGKWIRNLTAA